MRKKVLHIAPLDRNIGDNALNLAIRTMLGEAFEIQHMELVGNPFGQRAFETMQNCDAVIFGGGGVIHSCSGGGSRKNREKTGTMWNMDLDMIRDLRAKIIVYSAGFNKFDGEPEPLVQMGQFLDLLDEKGSLVSLRNDLSKDRLLKYFPRFGGIEVTPDPGMFCRGDLRHAKQPYALLQIACDRLNFRYPNGIGEFVELMAKLRELSPVPFYLIPHTTADRRVYEKLSEELKVDRIVDLGIAYDTVSEAMDLYRNAEFTISTRGHSQICSLGNGTPSFAMSTHPKARGFMVDMGQGDAVFDYLTRDPSECEAAFGAFLERLPDIRAELVTQNEKCDRQIAEFNQRIVQFVNGEHVPPSFVTDRGAQPEILPATLEQEILAKEEAARKERPPKIRTEKIVAYLPMRRKRVRAGTFTLDPKTPPPPAKAAARPARRWMQGKRKQKTRDGRTCGVVISCDANYFPAIDTCVRAVRRYNPELPVTFLDAGLTADQVSVVKRIVDDYAVIDELLNLDVTTFPSHLSKAALSSLYSHLAGYDKALYLDVDALVLGDLAPMFEALTEDADLVGVRGGLFRRLSRGYQHATKAEIDPKGLDLIKKFFPTADLNAPGINTGCFVVWNHVSRQWMGTAKKLFPFLNVFKTADQALLNTLMPISNLRLRLFDPMYNCMGFQLTAVRHDVQNFATTAKLGQDECSLHVADRRVVVAHFAGRSKPWNVSIDNPASYVWDWHAASSDKERRRVVLRHRLSGVHAHEEFMKEVELSGITPSSDFAGFIDVAVIARQRDLHRAAYELFQRAAAKRPDSFAALRSQCLLGPQMGRLSDAVSLYMNSEELQGSKDGKLKAFRDITIKAANGRDAHKHPATGTARHVLRLRALSRIGKDSAFSAELDRMTDKQKRNSEAQIYEGLANGMDQTTAIARVLRRYHCEPAILRKADNQAYRRAVSRTRAIRDEVAPLIHGGLVAQYGPSSGAFLSSLATVTQSRPVGIRNGISDAFFPKEFDSVALEEFDTYCQSSAEPLKMMVLANVSDRVSSGLKAMRAMSANLAKDGLVLIIDAVNTPALEDCFEGLSALPPVSKFSSIPQISEELKESDFDLQASWYVDGERILLYRKQSDKSTKLDWVRGACEPIVSAEQALQLALNASEGDAMAEPMALDAALKGEDPYNILAEVTPDRSGFPVLDDVSVVSSDGALMSPAKRVSASVVHYKDPGKGIHIAYWTSVNAGDKVLCEETHRLLTDNFAHIDFAKRDINMPMDSEAISSLNSASMVAIGGGGIIHSTSGPDGFIQWNIEQSALSKITVPLVFMGIGLNEFRQSGFYQSDHFRTSMAALLNKTAFMGLREKASVALLREFFPDQGHKIWYQPCPTVDITSRRSILNLPRVQTGSGPAHIAVNCAFDRSRQRYGARAGEALSRIETMIGQLLDAGHRVTIVAHCPEDQLAHAVIAQTKRVGLVDLSGQEPQAILASYLQFDLSIGMRTHSQLIPFGLGIPCIGIATHDKIVQSADDLGVPSWCVEMFDTEFVDKVLGRTKKILESRQSVQFDLAARALDAAKITGRNVKTIKRVIGMGD